ncbi:MAG: M15 family metallopeptidase [Pseudomonadota bacterium]
MKRLIVWRGIRAAAGVALLALAPQPAAAEEKAASSALGRLVAAYPDHLVRIEGNVLVWRDGTRMALDDGLGKKPFASWLAAPDIEDMLAVPYPSGPLAAPPPPDNDPGRARNAAFFARMYGDCRSGGVEKHLVDVVWLPRKSGQRLRVTRINGVARRLEAVSRELDKLPARYDRFLKPAAGGYVCRAIAGTDRVSAHGYGIAVDIAVGPSDYWRWARPGGGGALAYRNRVPHEIVEVFERQGFIWGGKWYHYDTMHFEYRPELLARPAQ